MERFIVEMVTFWWVCLNKIGRPKLDGVITEISRQFKRNRLICSDISDTMLTKSVLFVLFCRLCNLNFGKDAHFYMVYLPNTDITGYLKPQKPISVLVKLIGF